MIKTFFYLIIFLFLLDCSLNPNSKFWTEEKKILVDKGTACGVLLENGDKIISQNVISNAGIVNTYNQLLPFDCIKKDKLNTNSLPLNSKMNVSKFRKLI